MLSVEYGNASKELKFETVSIYRRPFYHQYQVADHTCHTPKWVASKARLQVMD